MFKKIMQISLIAAVFAAGIMFPQTSRAGTQYWMGGPGDNYPILRTYHRFTVHPVYTYTYTYRTVSHNRSYYKRPSAMIQFSTLISSKQGGTYGPSYRVIRDQRSYQRLWRRMSNHHGRPPRVDFRYEMVLFASMGQQSSGGHSVRINGIYDQGRRLKVVVNERRPGQGSFTASVMTAPVHMVVMPRIDKPVSFVVRSECRQYSRSW